MIPFSAATTVLAVKRYCIYCTYVILPVGARTCQSKSSLSTRVKIHFFNYDIVLITSAFSLRTFLYIRLQPKNVSVLVSYHREKEKEKERYERQPKKPQPQPYQTQTQSHFTCHGIAIIINHQS